MSASVASEGQENEALPHISLLLVSSIASCSVCCAASHQAREIVSLHFSGWRLRPQFWMLNQSQAITVRGDDGEKLLPSAAYNRKDSLCSCCGGLPLDDESEAKQRRDRLRCMFSQLREAMRFTLSVPQFLQTMPTVVQGLSPSPLAYARFWKSVAWTWAGHVHLLFLTTNRVRNLCPSRVDEVNRLLHMEEEGPIHLRVDNTVNRRVNLYTNTLFVSVLMRPSLSCRVSPLYVSSRVVWEPGAFVYCTMHRSTGSAVVLPNRELG
ncbi:hypothetical protein TGRH88_059680 [Toxoplasma gondii]|uniref:Uncharacterized protein n=1 Tax=Toxoplasma gondii TaxID=5811 RepID=A0A7J6JW94_TOXGO|nr:hypothetical protein TGRH88_059680 [Toxoplasma gondii]